MKRILLKRIGAVALAVAVSLTMGVTSFAAGTNESRPDVVGDATGAEVVTDSTTFSIPKGIIVKNDENIEVYSPAVEYTFELTPAAGGKTITSTVDNNKGTRTVKAGVEGGLTITNTGGKVTFSAAETPATVGTLGIELTKNIDLSVDLSKFNGVAGIYRYKIEDKTTNDTLTAAGITRETGYQTVRYIDLYLANDTSDIKVKVAGYAVIDGSAADLNINGDTNDTTAKNAGFVSGSKTNDSGQITEVGPDKADVYNTINVKLTKKVDGAMGDKQHAFPFTVDLANVGSTYYTTTDTAAGVQGNDETTTQLSQTLADSDSFVIKGLNPKATVTYTEKNDTTDAYVVTAAGADGTAITLTGPNTDGEVAANGTAKTAALNVSNYESCSTQSVEVDKANKEVTYTNTLGSISPTNVVMRYAPFLFIFGAAILLLVVMRKRRTHNAE